MARGVPVFLLLMPDEYEEELGTMIKAFRAVASRVRERLLFAYGFKDTEPWPQFAQSLGIDRGATGAFWMILGNNMQLTGRDWSVAWLRPPNHGTRGRNRSSAQNCTSPAVLAAAAVLATAAAAVEEGTGQADPGRTC